MKKKLFRRGQEFGKWTLESFLGGGGNGEVWKCKDDNGNIGAIKLLKTVRPKSYARFLDETTIIKNNSDINGIIPIIDDFLPTKLDREIPFYVMPVATSAEKELVGKSIEEKVDAIIEICQTLKDLHKRGISHRDIKLPNFLVYQSRFSIADFGLVDYPEKKDISFNNEEIGAKWTMAPEMRRESSSADGLKADIYSIAKTIWIILTENTKGFDGQYSTESILELRRFYPNKYTTPIDSLLATCTDNDPNSRPNIEDVILTLEDWKVLNEDFHERNQEQWFEIQRKLFPTAFPQRVIWNDLNDIVNVLKVLCIYDSLNHMFYPGGGGMDLEDARLANEEGCLELDFQVIEIVKPKRLMFESFGFDTQWNYFRLELDELEPTGIYETEDGEEPYEIRYDYESVTELYPGQYGKYDMADYRSEYEEMGYEIPKNARQVSRWFRGNFVIFNKRSIYNLTPDTYDGRHNKVNAEQFRKHIQSTVDMFKEKDAAKPIHEKLMERINSKRKTVHNKS